VLLMGCWLYVMHLGHVRVIGVNEFCLVSPQDSLVFVDRILIKSELPIHDMKHVC